MFGGFARGIILSDMEASIPFPTNTFLSKMVDDVRHKLLGRKMRVVVANEPRSYREVTVEVLRQLRPDVEFELTDPAGLEDTIHRLPADMVVCDEATPAVRDHVPIWLELYPGGNARSTVSVRGVLSTIEDVQLLDIVELVDRVIVEPPGAKGATS